MNQAVLNKMVEFYLSSSGFNVISLGELGRAVVEFDSGDIEILVRENLISVYTKQFFVNSKILGLEKKSLVDKEKMRILSKSRKVTFTTIENFVGDYL
jgi:hypothetical protein